MRYLIDNGYIYCKIIPDDAVRDFSEDEMVYYGIVSIAVVMFGFQFFFNDKFEKNSTSGLRQILKFTLGGNIAGLIVLFAINKFRFEFTPFSLIVALAGAVDGILCTFCSIKALGKINLSLYSLFTMLGGMVLPFAAGLIFFDEKLTVGTVICFVLCAVSLLFTVEKGSKNSGAVYYIGVFIFNGLSGVISTVYQRMDYPKVSETGFSVLKAAVVIVLCAAALAFNKEKKEKFNRTALIATGGNGILNCVANLLLLFSLAKLPASAQYPMVTGGVMIVSTIIAFFTPNKPKKKEIFAVILSFIGILALVLLP